LSKDIEIIKIFVAIQDVSSLGKYNVFLFEMRKQISVNKLLVISLSKKFTHLGVKNKKVYELMREYDYDLCLSTIENLSPRSHHFSLYGFKDEHEMIVQYIQNYNAIHYEGQTKQELRAKKEIFLLDTDSQANKWKWDIYEIKPTTLGFMLAIRYGLNRRSATLLSAFLALED